ncbi:MAG: aspartate/glutamate racemase family protein [Planctomycetota bacterium]|nr:aspartate/glutamate racemase family protein [Planctomycetota bacterium]
MGLKIWVQIAMGAPERDPGAMLWMDLMRKNMDLARDPETEISFHCPKKGLSDLEAFFHRHLVFLDDREVLDGVMMAEKEGYDAVYLACYYDPVLVEAKQAVNIPVIGPAEASLHVACMMAGKMGVVGISNGACHIIEEHLKLHGLEDRAVRPRPIPSGPTEQMEGMKDARHEIESFQKVGRQLIADGAEILIPGCLCMCPIMRLAPGREKEYPNGLTDVDGVPVMDVISVTTKMTEMMVQLNRLGSTWISRHGLYEQAPPHVWEMAKTMLQYQGEGLWQC